MFYFYFICSVELHQSSLLSLSQFCEAHFEGFREEFNKFRVEEFQSRYGVAGFLLRPTEASDHPFIIQRRGRSKF